MDVVFPKNNETRLLEMARLLGTREVMLVYPVSDPSLKQRKGEVERLSGTVGTVVTRFGILVSEHREVQRAKGLSPDIVAISRPWVYDDKRVRWVLNMENGRRADFTHHRNSGLNQVFIRKAIRTGKTFLINLNLLLSDGRETLLGRVLQNNRFFRKYRPDVLVVSGCSLPLEMRSEKDRGSLLRL